MSKQANKEGWIRHRGGKCPVSPGTRVDVRTRYDGEFFNVEAITGWAEDWSHTQDGGDIMAYRIHQPEQSTNDLERMAESIGIVRKDSAPVSVIKITGPLQWRDRITEIDRTVEALEEERVSLIQKLSDEGFQLIGRNDVKPQEEWQRLALIEDRKVAAVKAYRELNNSTLIEACDAVIAYRAENPC